MTDQIGAMRDALDRASACEPKPFEAQMLRHLANYATDEALEALSAPAPNVRRQVLEEAARYIEGHGGVIPGSNAFAALISGNNMPSMSGDGRDRMSSLQRRAFDSATANIAAAIRALASAPVQEGEGRAYCNKCGFYGAPDEHGSHMRPKDGRPCNYAAAPAKPAAPASGEVERIIKAVLLTDNGDDASLNLQAALDDLRGRYRPKDNGVCARTVERVIEKLEQVRAALSDRSGE